MPASSKQKKGRTARNAAKPDRDFTKPNDDNGWSFPIIFYDTSKPSDTAETAPKKIVYVNRHGLANGSPVFEKIFFDPNFIDASKTELVMTDSSYDAFLEFVNCTAVTYKSSETKPIDIDNIEMLRFADQYQMDSLLGRCKAFIAQRTPKLGIYVKAKRLTLGRLFGICHRTNNAALLPADIATKKISRFPLVEIRALDVDEQMQTSLLIAKLERYARLSDPPSQNQQYRSSSVDQLCDDDYCDCGENVGNTGTRQFAPDCPDCQQSFVFSTEADPDECGCNI